MEKKTLLSARRISKRFGGIQALHEAQLDLRAGEVHALVGANGAGKSTLIKIITGAVRMDDDGGELLLDDARVRIRNPHHARRLGISAVYQEFSLVNTLSVAENIHLGALPKKRGGLAVDWGALVRESERVLGMLDTAIDCRAPVRELSVAQKQVVEIAKALLNNSRVLIMDEPTASLTDNDIDRMFAVMRALRSRGLGILYVSHRLEELPQIADRVTVFRDGKYVVTLPIAEAPKNVIIEHMAGTRIECVARPSRPRGAERLRVEGLGGGQKFSNVSMTLHGGEILGLAGLAGAGRTEFARAVFGVDPYDAGRILINGREVRIRNPRQAKKCGMGFITEDRKEEGLVLEHSIRSNMAMAVFRRLSRRFRYRSSLERSLSARYIDELAIKAGSADDPAKSLSGGNQQKVVIAKWLATAPDILIMDEPTRGIDVGSKRQIYDLLFALSGQGKAILFISSEIPEILELSDRLLVMAKGRITGEFRRGQADQETILHYATLDGGASPGGGSQA